MSGKQRVKSLAKSVAVALLSLLFITAGSIAVAMYVFGDLPSRGNVKNMVSEVLSLQCNTMANATLCSGQIIGQLADNATDMFMATRLPVGKLVVSEPLLAWLLPLFGLSTEGMQLTMPELQQLMSYVLLLSLLAVALSAAGLALLLRSKAAVLKAVGGNVLLVGASALVGGLVVGQLLPLVIQLAMQQSAQQSTAAGAQYLSSATSGLMSLLQPKMGQTVQLGEVLSVAGAIIFMAGFVSGRKRKAEVI